MTGNQTAGAVTGVVFDFYGTLAPGTSASERDIARARVARAIGCDPRRYAAAVRESFNERARGVTGDPYETVRWLAARCGVDITDDVARGGHAVHLEAEKAFMRPRPETLEVLRNLKARGLRIGVLSDCTHELAMSWAELPYAAHIDAALFSVDTGVRKPDSWAYATVCERIGARPPYCLYVGDGGSNELTGARRAGLRAIQLRGPEFATSHTYGAEQNWDGDVITDLREIYHYVSAPRE